MSYYDAVPTRPSSNYALIEDRNIPLRLSVGRSLAQMWLGLNNDMIEAIVGRYCRGKFKGQLRGAISYKYVYHGGWIRNEGVRGRGLYGEPSLVDAFTLRPL